MMASTRTTYRIGVIILPTSRPLGEAGETASGYSEDGEYLVVEDLRKKYVSSSRASAAFRTRWLLRLDGHRATWPHLPDRVLNRSAHVSPSTT